MKKMISLVLCLLMIAGSLAVVANAEEFSVVGYWETISAQTEDMTFTQAELEAYGWGMWIDIREDGTATMYIDGEMPGITWSVEDTTLILSIDGDDMPVAINTADNTLILDFPGAGVFVFAKGDAAATEAPAEAAAAPADGVVGTWITANGTLVLNADGTGVYIAASTGAEYEKTWTASEGGCSFSDTWWEGYTAVIDENGNLNVENGKYVFAPDSSNVPAAAPVEAVAAPAGGVVGTWTTANGTLVLNEDGTGVYIAASTGAEYEKTWTASDNGCTFSDTWWNGYVAYIDEAGNLNVGNGLYVFARVGGAAEETAASSDGFVGTWKSVYLEMGVLSGDLRPSGFVSTLVLNADGTGSIDSPTPEEGTWYTDEAGVVRFGANGMAMTLMEGGFLKYGTTLGGYMVFSQDETAVWDPSMDTTTDEPVALADPLAEAAAPAAAPVEAAAPASADGIDLTARMGVKYIAKTYTSFGQTNDASLLGAEYSVIFYDGGTCDLTLGGTTVNGLSWSLQKVMAGLDEVDAFVINYSNTLFNCVITETGFNMDYFGSMNFAMEPAE